MQEKKQATLVMKKMLQAKGILDKHTYICSVHSYHEKTESLWLRLDTEELSELSLDAIYECNILESRCVIQAIGRIKERYCGEYGNMLELRIENGFYKKPIKSVDKR